MSRTMKTVFLAGLVALLSLASGCSLVFGTGISKTYDPRSGPPKCGDSTGAAIVDLLLSAGFATLGAYAVKSYEHQDPAPEQPCDPDKDIFGCSGLGVPDMDFSGLAIAGGVLAFAAAGAHLIGAISGFSDCSECNKAEETYEWWNDIQKKLEAKDLPPLHVAARTGNLKMAAMLLERSAYVNERDNFNRTPLHWAARSDNTKMVRFLVEKGANVNIKDKIGWTPFMHAEQYGGRETIEYLKKVSPTDNVGTTRGVARGTK